MANGIFVTNNMNESQGDFWLSAMTMGVFFCFQGPKNQSAKHHLAGWNMLDTLLMEFSQRKKSPRERFIGECHLEEKNMKTSDVQL